LRNHTRSSANQWYFHLPANLLYRTYFRNNLSNRVRFKTNYRQGLLWTWMPSLLPAGELVPPLATAASMHTAILPGGTWWLGERWAPILPFVLAGHGWRGEREPCRHWYWQDMPTWAVLSLPPAEHVEGFKACRLAVFRR